VIADHRDRRAAADAEPLDRLDEAADHGIGYAISPR